MIKIKISGELLVEILTTGYKTSSLIKVTEGLPDNCKLHLAEVMTKIKSDGKEIKTLELIFDDGKYNVFIGKESEAKIIHVQDISEDNLDYGESEKEMADRINKMRIVSINNTIAVVGLMEKAEFHSVCGYPSEVKIAEGEIGHNSSVRYKLCK